MKSGLMEETSFVDSGKGQNKYQEKFFRKLFYRLIYQLNKEVLFCKIRFIIFTG